MNWPKLSIKRHLLILSALVLVPQVLVGAYIAYTYAQDERASIERATVALSEALQNATDREVAGVMGLLQGLAAAPDIAEGDYGGFYRQARTAAASGNIDGIALRDLAGNQLANTNAPWGAALPSANPVARDFDGELLRTGQPAVSALHVGLVSRRHLLLVGTPVAVEGRTSFTLSAGIRPDRIRRLVQDQSIPEGWLGVVLDRDGRVIARSRDHERFVSTAASSDFLSGAVGLRGRFPSTTLDGVSVITTYIRSPLTNWTTIVSVPRSLLEAPVRALWQSLLGLSGLAVLTSLAAATLYSRRIGQSLRQLASTAAAVGGGDPAGSRRSAILEIDQVHEALGGASKELMQRARHQTYLMAELDHRVKNTLAVIQSLIGRTLKSPASRPQVTETLRGRVMALARAHEALSEAGWEPVQVRELVEVMSQAEGIRIDAEGPGATLHARAVVAFAQVVHELASNARRHGGLTPAQGHVAIHWSTIAADLVLHWREHGGAPSPGVPPAFGAQIMRLCVEQQLGGAIEFRCSPATFECEIRIPFLSSVLGRNAAPSSERRSPESMDGSGRTGAEMEVAQR